MKTKPTNFFSIKTNQTHEFPTFYFVIKTLHVSGISFAHHQELSTVHSTTVHFLQVRWQLPSKVRMELVPSWPCWAKEMPETC